MEPEPEPVQHLAPVPDGEATETKVERGVAEGVPPHQGFVQRRVESIDEMHAQ